MSNEQEQAGVVEVQVLAGASTGPRDATGRLPPGSELVADRSLGKLAFESVSTDDIQRAIEQICGSVSAALARVSPDSCSVEFGLGFKAGTKIPVLLSGEANATFKIVLSWKK